jgi:hypothetical protein
MEGIIINEICKKLSLPFKTVEARIQKTGIKPLTRQALYPYEILEKIKDIKMGRPKKLETKPKPPTPKTKHKK